MPRPSMDRKYSVARRRESFDEDWRFHRGDPAGTPSRLGYKGLESHLLNTMRATVGEGADPTPLPRLARAQVPLDSIPCCQLEFDDSDWHPLCLPHDWAIEGPFALDLPGETGKLPWQGVGWYRKRFSHTTAPDTEVYLELDGAMSFSTIWLNGHKIGGWPYGYTSFRVELTPWLNPSGNNVIAIRLDNPPNSSRWYPGAGLYRHLWLTSVPSVRVAHEGLFAHCPLVSADEAVVNVDLTFHNSLPVEVEAKVVTVITRLADDGRTALPDAEPNERVATCRIEASSETQRTLCHRVAQPRLWSLTDRSCYLVTANVEIDGQLIDRVECVFGIRTAVFDVERGFLLNGEHVPIRGVCMHHDLGALGTAVNVRAIERQIEILQTMGCNAIRTSHNPPARELLDLCDRMGILLMVEAFDCWRRGKKTPEGLKEGDEGFCYYDYGRVYDDWHDADLRSMVRASRNHPSVVCYSIGNEVIEQWHTDGWKYAVHLAGIVREEDRTRAITAGCNGEIAAYRGFQTAVDVIGLNYKPLVYTQLHTDNPMLRIIGSETASTISTRGEYFFPLSDDKSTGQVNFQVSSYDLSAPPWAFRPDEEFRGLDDNPCVAGEFVWTGFDYLGEPTPYNSDATNLLNFSDPTQRETARLELERLGKISVPSRSSYFGIVDLAGFPKDRFYLYQARWRPDLPMAHILPHWNWPERIGQVTPVHVYSTADEAELFLNGRSQGRQARGPRTYRFRWDSVRYEPGELKVVTYRQGRPWATAVRHTAGPAVRLAASSDREVICHAGCDLAFVTVRVQDERGQIVPRSRPEISCHIEGPAHIAATDNGDPTSLVRFTSSVRAAHQGLLLVILKAQRDGSGSVRLRLEADGLQGCELNLKIAASPE